MSQLLYNFRGIYPGLDRLGRPVVVHELIPPAPFSYDIPAALVRPYVIGEAAPAWVSAVIWDPFLGHSGTVPGPVTIDPPEGIYVTTESPGSSGSTEYDPEIDDFVAVQVPKYPRTVCIPGDIGDFTRRDRRDLWCGGSPVDDFDANALWRPPDYSPRPGQASCFRTDFSDGIECCFVRQKPGIHPYFFLPLPIADTAPLFGAENNTGTTGRTVYPSVYEITLTVDAAYFLGVGAGYLRSFAGGAGLPANYWSTNPGFDVEVVFGWNDDIADTSYPFDHTAGTVTFSSDDYVLSAMGGKNGYYDHPSPTPAILPDLANGLARVLVRVIATPRSPDGFVPGSATNTETFRVIVVHPGRYDIPLPFTVCDRQHTIAGGVPAGSLPDH